MQKTCQAFWHEHYMSNVNTKYLLRTIDLSDNAEIQILADVEIHTKNYQGTLHLVSTRLLQSPAGARKLQDSAVNADICL